MRLVVVGTLAIAGHVELRAEAMSGWQPAVPHGPSRPNATFQEYLCDPDADLGAQAWDLESLERIDERLAAALLICAESASLYWQKGVALRRMGRVELAAEALERALMVNPALAGAMLEYALLMEQVGELASAESLYEELLSRYEPPAAVGDFLRSRLSELRRRVAVLAAANQPLPSAGRKHRAPLGSAEVSMGNKLGVSHEPNRSGVLSKHTGQWGVGLAFDSNLNSAPRVSGITLTTIDGPLTLEFAKTDRPKAAATPQTEGAYRYQEAWGNRIEWFLQTRAYARAAPNAAQNLQYGELSAGLDHRLMQHTVTHQIEGQWLRFGQATGSEVFRYTGALKSNLDYLSWRCLVTEGFEIDVRAYPLQPTLDGKSATLLGKMSCASNALAWETWARIGYDQARTRSRAGGNQHRGELGLGLLSDFETHFNRLSLIASVVSDQDGYNPLIQNGKKRFYGRVTTVLERGLKLKDPSWVWLWSLTYNDQRSSIDLFDIRSWSIASTWRYRY